MSTRQSAATTALVLGAIAAAYAVYEFTGSHVVGLAVLFVLGVVIGTAASERWG